MEKQELYYKLTGTETPRFITERENIIIDKCLGLINERDEYIQELINEREYATGLVTKKQTDIDDLKKEIIKLKENNAELAYFIRQLND